MVLFVVAFIAIVALAVGVMAVVALQARREGREVLTPQGEQLVQSARERTCDLAGDIAHAARSARGGAQQAPAPAPQARKTTDATPAPVERRPVPRRAPVRGESADEIDLRDRDDISA